MTVAELIAVLGALPAEHEVRVKTPTTTLLDMMVGTHAPISRDIAGVFNDGPSIIIETELKLGSVWSDGRMVTH